MGSISDETDSESVRNRGIDEPDVSEPERTRQQRTDEQLRDDIREQMAQEIDTALEAHRAVYNAAARWMAIQEFIMQADGRVVLALVEKPAFAIEGERCIRAAFEQAIGETDVENQLDNFADDVMTAIAIENEKRRASERASRTRLVP